MNEETLVALVIFGGLVICFLGFLSIQQAKTTGTLSLRELARYGVKV